MTTTPADHDQAHITLTAPIAFAGGGTGGHIYPALAINEQLSPEPATPPPLFIHSTRHIDRTILEPTNLPHAPIPATTLSLHPAKLLAFARAWKPAVNAARELLTTHGTRAVVLMGGFVTAPAAAAAKSLNIPTLLVNLDAVPGKANRLAARTATRIVSAAQSSSVPASWEPIPPIVRKAATPNKDPESARATLGLEPHHHTLLVTGGSQGATGINNMMARLAPDIAALNKRLQSEGQTPWQIIHLAGPDRAEPVKAAYRQHNINAAVHELLDDMASAWAAASLALSRAGASSVAEAWASHTPALFLPYPHHKDNHQALNAAPLVNAGAALLRTDHDDTTRNATDAGRVLLSILEPPHENLHAMHHAAQSLPPADGARRAARIVAQLAAENATKPT